MRAAIIKIYMISSDGCCRDDAHLGTLKEFFITPCPCTDQKRISIDDVFPAYVKTFLINDLTVRLEHTFKERYIHICYKLHIYLKIKFLTIFSSFPSETNSESSARCSFSFCNNMSLWKYS